MSLILEHIKGQFMKAGKYRARASNYDFGKHPRTYNEMAVVLFRVTDGEVCARDAIAAQLSFANIVAERSTMVLRHKVDEYQ